MENPYSNIHERVSVMIEGRSGRKIGIVLPDRKPTQAELIDLHRTIAEIAINAEIKKLQSEEAAS